ncbi:MAG: S9 family peptidase [Actinomycetota bacterium]
MTVTNTKLIPLEVLLGNPEKVQPQISPDGTRMSYIAPVNGVLNVWVGDVGKDNYAPVTADTDRGIRGYAWAHNNRHLIYIQDQGGDENWRVYSVDLENNETRDLTPFENVQARIQAMNKDFPDEVLIAMNKDNQVLHDVYHCDLKTGELAKIAENTGYLAWVVDKQMKVRSAVAMTMEGGMTVLVRDSDEGEFRPLIEFGPDDLLTSGPVGFTADGKGMYLRSSKDANTGRLVKMDIATGEEEVIAEDPNYDVSGVLVHPDTREIQAVAFLRDRVEWQVLDASIQEDFDAIRSLHEGDFGVTDRDHADRTWVVAFTADDGPVSYYVLDRASKQATFLFDHRPDLNEYDLAKMEPFEIKARDGLTVHGYLTFPANSERKDLPTVLNVHGGPWVRDTWGFDPEAQWLANRRYLSVQVNYRGSTGYGKAFTNAGDKEWGGKMHDDLIDVVNWVVEQGFADPKRLAIMGASYGGYSALVGATFTPDVFSCAVAMVGPTNLKTFIETVPPYWQPQIVMLHNRVGNPETEEEFLWSRSPLSKVDNIEIPMLIAHGANDPRVKLAETEQIVAAMKEKRIDHELIVFDDEGHGFAKPENNLKFYGMAEKFLAKHLEGRAAE